MSAELNKYFKSEPIEILRSQITLANYNPRRISDEAKRMLKANIKRNGLLGGLVWNEQTGNLVSGHQRITVLDEINKYNGTQETDYLLRVEKVSLDLKTEKEQNVFMNSQTVQGEFDEDLMRELIHDIDYKLAGLDDHDLNLYGIDLSDFENEELQEDIDELYQPVAERKQAEAEQRKQAVKDMKQQIKEKGESKAQDMESYVTLSFSSYQTKSAFMKRFGYDPLDKFIKGEILAERVEIID